VKPGVLRKPGSATLEIAARAPQLPMAALEAGVRGRDVPKGGVLKKGRGAIWPSCRPGRRA